MEGLDELVGGGVDARLRLLGVREGSCRDLVAAVDTALRAPGGRERAAALAARLEARAGGQVLEGSDPLGGPEDGPGADPDGLLAVAALVASAPAVRARLTGRGVPAAVADATLADLGLQVEKHRRVHGRVGLLAWWLGVVWSGRLVRLGRLQLELARSEAAPTPGAAVTVARVHIPGDGALSAVEVDASLDAAGPFLARHFADAGPLSRLECESWLLDPGLAALLPGSNLAGFQARWRPLESGPGDRDAAYFGFDLDPPGGRPDDLDALPRDTRLRRTLVDLWSRGESVRVVRGWMPVPAGAA